MLECTVNVNTFLRIGLCSLKRRQGPEPTFGICVSICRATKSITRLSRFLSALQPPAKDSMRSPSPPVFLSTASTDSPPTLCTPPPSSFRPPTWRVPGWPPRNGPVSVSEERDGSRLQQDVCVVFHGTLPSMLFRVQHPVNLRCSKTITPSSVYMFITHMLMRIPEPPLFPTVVKPTPVPTLPPTPTPPPTIPPAWAGERLKATSVFFVHIRDLYPVGEYAQIKRDFLVSNAEMSEWLALVSANTSHIKEVETPIFRILYQKVGDGEPKLVLPVLRKKPKKP